MSRTTRRLGYYYYRHPVYMQSVRMGVGTVDEMGDHARGRHRTWHVTLDRALSWGSGNAGRCEAWGGWAAFGAIRSRRRLPLGARYRRAKPRSPACHP